MYEPAMPTVGKSLCWKHHPARLLQNHPGKAPSIPVSECGRTFCSNTGTPYHRLQHRRATFDEVVALSVEGLNISAIARVKGISWNTVARWLEKAADSCRRFNDRNITGIIVTELQADEIRTIVGGKDQPIWIFASIEVWSRLWPATVVGRRSCRNTRALFGDISSRMNLNRVPLISTDGFEFYKKVIRRIFGPACLYGQVIKTRRNDRVIKVERRAVIGDAWRFEEALLNSEDSSKLNTSFIERLNLTICRGSAYFFRRTSCQARWKERLEDHLELLRCHYNFVRPHRALKFGQRRSSRMRSGMRTLAWRLTLEIEAHRGAVGMAVPTKSILSPTLVKRRTARRSVVILPKMEAP